MFMQCSVIFVVILAGCKLKRMLSVCWLQQPWYKKPSVTGNMYFAETFESNADFKQRSDFSFIFVVKCRITCCFYVTC